MTYYELLQRVRRINEDVLALRGNHPAHTFTAEEVLLVEAEIARQQEQLAFAIDNLTARQIERTLHARRAAARRRAPSAA